MKIDQRKLKSTYQALADTAGRIGAPDYFVEMTRAFDTQEIWRDYVGIYSAWRRLSKAVYWWILAVSTAMRCLCARLWARKVALA
jgi:hypothetical protein